MTHILIYESVSSFAEDKDVAREIRETKIKPALEKGEEIILDFSGVSLATQSFIHALISDPIRLQGPDVLDRISFKNCNETVKTLVTVVCDYMQDSFGAEQ